MAKEVEVWEVLEKIGYKPREKQSIVVTYAPKNLSGRFARFFDSQFYVLQICEEELVLVPIDKTWLNLKKEVTLSISFDEIQFVNIDRQGLNYEILIKMDEDLIRLFAQGKALSEFRTSGTLAGQINFAKNWHKENLDATISALESLSA